MKKQLLLLTFILSNIALFSQVNEEGCLMSLGKQPAYVIDHEGADKKTVMKVVENTFKDFGKLKKNKKAKEVVCEQCLAPLISSTPMNIYIKGDEGKNRYTTYIMFDDGQKFIDSSNEPAQSKVIVEILQNMAYDVQREVIKKELKDAENQLKGFEKDLSKLEKKNEDLHSDIENYKEKIIKAEKEIEKNFSEQDEKRMEIEKQGREVEKIIKKLNNVGRTSF